MVIFNVGKPSCHKPTMTGDDRMMIANHKNSDFLWWFTRFCSHWPCIVSSKPNNQWSLEGSVPFISFWIPLGRWTSTNPSYLVQFLRLRWNCTEPGSLLDFKMLKCPGHWHLKTRLSVAPRVHRWFSGRKPLWVGEQRSKRMTWKNPAE